MVKTRFDIDYIVEGRKVLITNMSKEEVEALKDKQALHEPTFNNMYFDICGRGLELVHAPELAIIKEVCSDKKLNTDEQNKMFSLIKNADRAFIGVNSVHLYLLDDAERVCISAMNTNRRKLLNKFLEHKGKYIFANHRITKFNTKPKDDFYELQVKNGRIFINESVVDINKEYLRISNSGLKFVFNHSLIPYAILGKVDYLKILQKYNFPEDGYIKYSLNHEDLIPDKNEREVASQYLSIFLATLDVRDADKVNILSYYLSKMLRRVFGMPIFDMFTYDFAESEMKQIPSFFPSNIKDEVLPKTKDFIDKLMPYFDDSNLGIEDTSNYKKLLYAEHILDNLIYFRYTVVLKAINSLSSKVKFMTLKVIYKYLCICMDLDTSVVVTDEDKFVNAIIDLISGEALTEAFKLYKEDETCKTILED